MRYPFTCLHVRVLTFSAPVVFQLLRLPKMNRDIRFTRRMIKILSFLGIAPLYLEKDKHIASIAYSIALESVFTFLLVLGGYINLILLKPSVLNCVNLVTESFIDTVLVFTCSFSSIARGSDWRKVFQLFGKFERRHSFAHLQNRVKVYRFVLVMVHVLVLVTQIGWCFGVGNIKYLLYIIFSCLRADLVAFHFITADLLTQRYNFLSERLHTSLKELYICHHLRDFFISIGTLRNINDHLNAIFGWYMLVLHTKCFSTFFNGINLLFNLNNEIGHLVTILTYLMVISVSILL